MKLVYNVHQRPSFPQTLLFAFQQLLAILAATIAVPAIVGNGMSQSAALFGAGVGTLVYLLFTKFKSPVFLGSSFAFINSMLAAFAGGVSMSLGYLGLLIGAASAGLVYVAIAVAVKFFGVGWIDKLMPAVVIGPTVAVIGLGLSPNAIGDLVKGSVYAGKNMLCSPYIALLCGLITLFTTLLCSVYGSKQVRMIPFILGILAGYAVAALCTVVGNTADVDALKIIDFSKFANMDWTPDFTFLKAFSGDYTITVKGVTSDANIATYIGTILVAYVPVSFVVFAEHIADHKNISSIIESDLLRDPGLSRTLLGDGVGSIAGAFFGGCPNTTYGESIGCVAISGNASIVTIFTTAILAIVSSFIAPFTTFLATIPNCVMGGVCVALYGFIAVSGLKMLQPVDLSNNSNLFVASIILVCGVGGLTVSIETGSNPITITSVACALILGVIANAILNADKNKKK